MTFLMVFSWIFQRIFHQLHLGLPQNEAEGPPLPLPFFPFPPGPGFLWSSFYGNTTASTASIAVVATVVPIVAGLRKSLAEPLLSCLAIIRIQLIGVQHSSPFHHETVWTFPQGCIVEATVEQSHLGLSENVVYPYTQWLMIIIPTKWL